MKIEQNQMNGKFWNTRYVSASCKPAKALPVRTRTAQSIMAGKGSFKARLQRLLSLVHPF